MTTITMARIALISTGSCFQRASLACDNKNRIRHLRRMRTRYCKMARALIIPHFASVMNDI